MTKMSFSARSIGSSRAGSFALVLVGATVLTVGVGGCTNPPILDSGSGGSTSMGGNAGGNAGGNSGGIGGATWTLPPVTDAAPVVPGGGHCGNGVLDGEGCDDGNTVGGDGCSQSCQIEANWICPDVGKPCQNQAVCGNGKLTSNEVCDDGNTISNDGCSSDCQTIDPGYICPAPGKPCVPLCGDSVITGTESCDDGNTASGDGCSANCQVEPGWSCTGTPSKCTEAVCGNGILETGEACDCGTDPAKLPTGCTGPNGLFNGDGSGCSGTCTKEPVCRGTTGSGTTHACTTSCGNGNLETGEDCDDGNLVDGDGCSSKCKIEDGFKCTTQATPDTVACTQTIYSGNCLELPVKYRDFKSEHETGGHPDFFYYGNTLASGNAININGVQGQTNPLNYNKRYCVPNSAGPARQNDSTARCWDMAQANLDSAGRPAFNTTRNGGGSTATLCDCQFTDWSHDTNGGNVPGYTMTNSPLNGLTYVSGSSGHPVYKGPAPVATSATSFGQWFTDSTYTNNTHKVSFLELGPVASATNLYRFTSPPHSVYGGFFPLDPAANNFPMYSPTGSTTGPGTVQTSTTGNSEPLLCNIWPYWYSSSSFGAGNGCKGNQYVFPPSFAPGVDPATWFGQHPNGDWIPNAQGWFHDSWFSIEARYLFAFNDAFQLQFFGDDDTFVFINGVLVIDLGGVHQRIPGSVKVDASGNATIQEGGNIYMPCTGANCPTVVPTGYAVGDLVPCDGSANAKDPVTKVAFNSTCAAGTTCDCRQRTLTATQLGLQKGNTYEIAVFSRACQPRCGDGVVSGGEECDCGDGTGSLPAGCTSKNDDNLYGGCTTQCKWGPYCGDGIVQNTGGGTEQCDKGNLNGTKDAQCSASCMKPAYCGDGNVDTNLGEQCDLGPLNGQPSQPCDQNCQYIVG